VIDVPADTRDKDEIVESEFFDTRQAFLSLCQGNHYQYDTLRRAKHSSMMVLYHLHNPTAPAFVTTCNICMLRLWGLSKSFLRVIFLAISHIYESFCG
jgi:E1A/CREB-binding protein